MANFGKKSRKIVFENNSMTLLKFFFAVVNIEKSVNLNQNGLNRLDIKPSISIRDI
jgi:hypothetical protein